MQTQIKKLRVLYNELEINITLLENLGIDLQLQKYFISYCHQIDT